MKDSDIMIHGSSDEKNTLSDHLFFAMNPFISNNDGFVKAASMRFYNLASEHFDLRDMESLKHFDTAEKIKLFIEKSGNQNDIDTLNYMPKLFSAIAETVSKYIVH